MNSAKSPILVIGRTGQLAQSLAATGREDILCAGRPEGDLADARRLERLMERVRPRIVINAGGFTKVDLAESQSEEAYTLNRDGPAALARLCAGAGIPLIHVSTDCVFDGRKGSPYTRRDIPAPLNVYGKSKLEGEQAVAGLCPEHLIVRVSWVFSGYGENFVRTMLKVAGQRDEVSVVRDQIGYPTYCPDIADGLLQMAGRVLEPGFANWGTFHLAGREETDRASMASAIFEQSRAVGGPWAKVIPVLTSDYPTPAARPLNARLGSHETAEVFGIELADWKDRLKQAVTQLVPALS